MDEKKPRNPKVTKRWHDSAKGRAAQAKYVASDKGKATSTAARKARQERWRAAHGSGVAPAILKLRADTKLNASQSRTRWTQEADRDLADLTAAGVPTATIAIYLGRSLQAIEHRRMYLRRKATP